MFAIGCMLFAILALGQISAISAPANDESFVLEQPDDSSFSAMSRGDEWLNWTETDAGYAIGKSEDGYWYYVTGYDNKNTPVFSTIPANKPPLASFVKHLKPCGQSMHKK